MELHKIGQYIILTCIFLVLMPTPVAADDTIVSTHYPGINQRSSLSWMFQEKSQIVYTANDFIIAGETATQNGNYEEAIKNFNKAEDMILARDVTRFKMSTDAALSDMEAKKALTYANWPGHEKEAAQAVQDAKTLEASSKVSKGFMSSQDCLIVTATFGSPLSSEVQLVRNFRDDSIKQSYTGSRFMPGFNTWYYSFSPQVSTYINEHPFTKPAMQVILAPLLGIVRVSQIGYSFLAFSPELATFASMLIGSILYACLYVFPFVLVVMWVAQRRGWKGWNIQHMKPVACVWAAIAVLLVLGVLLSVDLLTTVASGLFVVATIILVAGGLSVSLLQYTHTPKTS